LLSEKANSIRSLEAHLDAHANANAMPFWQNNLDEPVAKNLRRDPPIRRE